MKLLDQKEALRALADGDELEYELENDKWLPMTNVENPINRPNRKWRVKVTDWVTAYDRWSDISPHDLGEEAGFEAGWYAAMEFNKSKKP
ncbi:MAG: hypothetical protein AXW14_08560 [Alteromonas sp. Nap_26]|nr:MAG: hypothetical protein AXW14_08560 [Alteromonas sp. Nap_26]